MLIKTNEYTVLNALINFVRISDGKISVINALDSFDIHVNNVQNNNNDTQCGTCVKSVDAFIKYATSEASKPMLASALYKLCIMYMANEIECEADVKQSLVSLQNILS